jgi:WD repeat and SOF domain-containing protein 1
MPKIQVICRDSNNYEKKTKSEIEKVFRNPNPVLHPQLKAREYVRALNSAKLDKIFAKPFLFALSNHTDGVKVMAKNNKLLSEIVSGTFDGQIILWDLPRRTPIFNITSRHDYVKGLVFNKSGSDFLSVGDDQKINIWNKSLLYEEQVKNFTNSGVKNYGDEDEEEDYFSTKNNVDFTTQNNGRSKDNTPFTYTPKFSYTSETNLESIDHSTITENQFATAGGNLALWDYNRSKPITVFKSSSDGFIKVKYNYVEENIMLATGMDRSISLYDTRINTPTHNVILNNKSAAACWNPQEPFSFTLGNEDSNCYTFDTRRLDKVKFIHKDHLLAVLDIDYSPTGREFVSASFDKTIRLWDAQEGRSKEVYYNKRMQK